MGTHHIVTVTMDGKDVIRQYGQWDGYAETAGYELCKSIKRFKPEYLRKLLQNVTTWEADREERLYNFNDDVWERMTRFSALYNNAKVDAGWSKKPTKMKEYDITVEPNATYVDEIKAAIKQFGYNDPSEYYMITRDTGYKILNVLDVLFRYGQGKPIVAYKTRAEEWRNYKVDLDKEEFTIEFDGLSPRIYKFDKLPSESTLKIIDEQF